jgi:HPt (histidine-containing phosphotransfer) domain-containing protein
MSDSFTLDRALIMDRLGGDEDIYRMMLDMYLQDVEGNCAAISAALAAGDARATQREAHTIKGLLATFSDDQGAAAAYAIEIKAKAGDIAGLEAPLAALQGRLHDVAGVLKAEVARLAG